MPRLFRDGYWRDVLVLVLMTVTLGSGIAWGLAWGVDAFFGDAVSSLIGDAGEYDVMLQMRNGQAEAADSDIRRVIDEHLPGAELREGVSLAGQTYYFLKIPPKQRTAETLERLGDMFQPVSGFIGHSLLIEPSIVVNGIHDAISQDVIDVAEGLPDVDFTFRNRANLVIVLRRPEGVARVQARLESLLGEKEIIEVRLPLGSSFPNTEEATRTVESTLQGIWGDNAVRAAQVATKDADAETYVTTLTEMRRFLLGYATRIVVPGAQEVVGRRVVLLPETEDTLGGIGVQLEGVTEDGRGAWGYIVNGQMSGREGPWLAYAQLPDGSPGEALGVATVSNERSALVETLDESVRLLGNLSDFAGEARDSVHQADAILAAFDEAVGRLETLDQQIQMLEKSLADMGGTGKATPTQALLSVLLSGWLNRLSGGEPPPPTDAVGSRLLQLDLPAIETTLNMLAEGVTELAELDVQAVIAQIEQLQRTLPMLDDEEIARSVRLIDDNLGGGGIPGDRITLLVSPGVQLKSAERALTTSLGIPGVHIVRTATGVIAPNARMALSQILGQVRELIAALIAMAIVLLTLFLDHSLLLSVERLRGMASNGSRKQRYAGALLGATTGTALLVSISLLSGGQIPILGWSGLVVLGSAFGVITAMLAERISPIDADEVVAGEALGLTHAQIMQEIVVPMARPGLLALINRWRQHFR